MRSKVNRRKFLQASAVAGAVAMSKSASAKKETKAELVPIPDEPVTRDDYKALKKTGEEVFTKDAVTIRGYTFHMPSSGSYPSLFAWDSGWHAIAMTRIDPKIAASEIEFLLLQQMPDGRVPHEVEFEEIKVRKSVKSVLGGMLSRDQYYPKNISVQMDPPSYMIAAEKIYAQTKDDAWVKRILPIMEKCIYWMTHTRDLFKDGLVCIVHPWESGTDSSPAYDEILHISFKTPFGAPRRMFLYPQFFTRFKHLGYDINKIAADNVFIVEDLTVISIAIRAIISVANLNQAVGNLDKAKALRDQAQQMMDTVDRIHWDDKAGCYFIRYDLKNPKFSKRNTCASLLPVFTGLAKKEHVERVIHEHILNPKRYWLPYVFSFNADDEMQHDKFYGEDVLLWRGHCIWSNMNWMIADALNNYGYKKEARELTRRMAKMIRHEGYREFYDYRTGQGRRAYNFGWAGLVLDMINDYWPEAVS